jgi:predicted PurR-regulated permease PerM
MDRVATALLVMAILYTLYFASSLLIPIVLSIMLSLLLFPSVNFLSRLYVPRAVSAALLLIAIGVPFTLLGMQLVEPAQKWIERVPELTATLNEKVETITDALAPAAARVAPEETPEQEETRSGLARLFDWFGDDEEEVAKKASTAPSAEKSTAVADRLVLGGLDMTLTVLAQTPIFLAQVLVCLFLVLFLLVFGPGIYATAVDVFPRLQHRLRAGQLVADTQRQLSRYILTVSLINAGLGLCTAIALWLMRFEDPLLWGTMVALLNFAPYIGPLFSVAILCIAGWAQYGLVLEALFPAAVYFIINGIEAQLITPAVLGRNMRMNPLIIMLWLILWGWLWGIAGVLIAVPLLVCIKLVLARFDRFEPWLKLIESRA